MDPDLPKIKKKKRKRPSKEDLAYIAGLIDGEGCIAIRRWPQKKVNTFVNIYALVEIDMVDDEGLLFVNQFFPVNLVTRKGRKKEHRSIIVYSTAKRELVEEILLAVLPYLKVKFSQATTVLAFLGCKDKKTKEIYYRKMRELNRRGTGL